MNETAPAQPASPSLETIARLVEQGIEEQRETRERLDTPIRISTMQFAGFEKMIDGVRSTTSAQFLLITEQLTDTRKHVERIEEHVGFLTTKVVEHDKRFDAHDKRFDAHDKRFDAIDTRLDAHDKRFDAIDTRLDAHDKRFDAVDSQLRTIVAGVVELRRLITDSAASES